jgi:hypothetical protein
LELLLIFLTGIHYMPLRRMIHSVCSFNTVPAGRLLFSTGCEKYRGPDEAIQSQELRPYTHCTFADGLQIVAVDPLARGVTARTVETATGKKLVPMLAGIRIMFAYPDTDFFANV